MTSTPPQHIYPNAQQETNGLGLAGFICSLIGIFTGGVLSPIGLILSLIALGREPKGFAIAGVILGLIGSCGAILVFLIFGASILACLGVGMAGMAVVSQFPEVEAGLEMSTIAAEIQRYQQQNNDVLPGSLTSLNIDQTTLTDPWGNPYRYLLDSEIARGFELVSDGPDGRPGTADDITFSDIQSSSGRPVSGGSGN